MKTDLRDKHHPYKSKCLHFSQSKTFFGISNKNLFWPQDLQRVSLKKMPRCKVECPLCGQITDRPPQHLRVKHRVPHADIPGLVQQARNAAKRTLSLEQVQQYLPKDRPISETDVFKVIKSIGYAVKDKTSKPSKKKFKKLSVDSEQEASEEYEKDDCMTPQPTRKKLKTSPSDDGREESDEDENDKPKTPQPPNKKLKKLAFDDEQEESDEDENPKTPQPARKKLKTLPSDDEREESDEDESDKPKTSKPSKKKFKKKSLFDIEQEASEENENDDCKTSQPTRKKLKKLALDDEQEESDEDENDKPKMTKPSKKKFKKKLSFDDEQEKSEENENDDCKTPQPTRKKLKMLPSDDEREESDEDENDKPKTPTPTRKKLMEKLSYNDEQEEFDEDENDDRKYERSSPRGQKMKSGLYKQIKDKTDPLLRGFHEFLVKKRGVTSSEMLSKSVKQISWLLAFCQRNDGKSIVSCDLSSLTKHNFSKYLDRLKECGLKGTSRKNVHKTVNHFVKFIETCSNLDESDPEVFHEIKKVGKCSATWQTAASRDMLKEDADKKYRQMQDYQLTPFDCCKVIRLGEKEAQRICSETGPFNPRDHRFLTRYCIAIIIACHGQRPGVIENFMMTEYFASKTVKDRKVFTVKTHKTDSFQPANFSLSMKHFNFFEIYHERLQETIAHECRGWKVPMRKYFFVQYPEDGELKRIMKPSQEFKRFQRNTMKIPNSEIINATTCRKAIQTAMKHGFSKKEQERVNEYLAHSGNVARRHYRMVTQENVAITADMLERITQEEEVLDSSSKGLVSLGKTATVTHSEDLLTTNRNVSSSTATMTAGSIDDAVPLENARKEVKPERFVKKERGSPQNVMKSGVEDINQPDQAEEVTIQGESPPRLNGPEANLEDIMYKTYEVTAMSSIPTLGSLRDLFRDTPTYTLKMLQSRWAYQQRRIRRMYLAHCLLDQQPTDSNIRKLPFFRQWNMNEQDVKAIVTMKK